MTDPLTASATLCCPICRSDVSPQDAFCEACGAPLTARSGEQPESRPDLSAPIWPPPFIPATTGKPPAGSFHISPCGSCGEEVGVDGSCSSCGTNAPSSRDHYVEQPSDWVAACCDRGVRHDRNEDATAVASQAAPRSRAVLVVCDGVSTSLNSDVASLAAARAARDALVAHQPAGSPTSRPAATAIALRAAVEQANAAVIAATDPDSPNAASCTLAAAVLDGDAVVFANVGDSRVYWLPDPGAGGTPVELSRDDSVAQARIEMGVDRAEAERGPQAHAITKWLGRDSSDFSPRTGSLTLRTSGWLLVCSDGLWNYVSAAADLQALVTRLSGAAAPAPLALAEALVAWANEQGGKDNVSVALARH